LVRRTITLDINPQATKLFATSATKGWVWFAPPTSGVWF